MNLKELFWLNYCEFLDEFNKLFTCIVDTKKIQFFSNWIFEIFYERARLKYKNKVNNPKTMFGIHEATSGDTYPFSENVDVV